MNDSKQIPSSAWPKVTVGRNLAPQGEVLFASSDDRGNPGRLNQLVLSSCGYDLESLRDLPLAKDGFGVLSEPGKSTIVVVVTIGSGRPPRELLSENFRRSLDFIPSIRSDTSSKRVWIPLLGTGSAGLSHKESLSVTLESLRQTSPRWQPFVSEVRISCPKELSERDIQEITDLSRDSFGLFGVELVPLLKRRKSNPPNRTTSVPVSIRRFEDNAETLIDTPTSKIKLGFNKIAKQIVEVVHDATTGSGAADYADAAADARLTIGLFAPWGSGKSTLIKEISRQFRERGHLVIVVNPWKWDGKGDIPDHVRDRVLQQFSDQRPRADVFIFGIKRWLRSYGLRAWFALAAVATLYIEWPLLKHVIEEIAASVEPGNDGKPGDQNQTWIKIFGGIGWEHLAPLLILVAPKLWSLFGQKIFDRCSVWLFSRRPERLGADGLSEAYQDIAALLYRDQKGKKPFVLFFEDLDRCSPERVATVLESVHSLTVAGCVTFLASDDEYLIAAINAYYDNVSKVYSKGVNFGRKYLEKIVQIGFRLPLIRRSDIFELGIAEYSVAAQAPLPIPGGQMPTNTQAAVSSGLDSDSERPVEQASNSSLQTLKLKEIIGELLEQAVEPMGLNVRQAKAISNTLKLYLGIAECSTDIQARQLAAFVFADRFDPDWLDSYYHGFDRKHPPIGANQGLATLLVNMIGSDKEEMLRIYHFLGRRPNDVSEARD